MSSPLFYSVIMIEDEPNVSEPISIFVEQQDDMSMAGVFRTVEDFLQKVQPGATVNMNAGAFAPFELLQNSDPNGENALALCEPDPGNSGCNDVPAILKRAREI